MNPLFGLMMNMGIGCMPSPFMMGMNFMMPSLFCGCSNFMTMPYYQNDNLGFLNFPIMRNTSADYLLDPNLALKQCQMNWQNGGGFFGTSILPGFTFPPIAPIAPIGTYPVMPGVAQPVQKTEEERRAEEEAKKKKEEQEAKPAAKEAKKCYELFNTVKKLAEDKTNLFPEITEELSQKAEEAMKKETAEEQLSAMKEVLSAIPADTLRKAALADDKVRIMLRKAGYNFNLLQNKYSVKNDDIKKDDIDHIDKLRKLHVDIQEKKFNELALVTGLLSHTDEAKAKILGVISSWNDRFNSPNERGIIRYIAANLPLGENEEAKLGAVQECTKIFVLALLAKADEFDGYEKITKAREDVQEKLNTVIAEGGFTKPNLDKLADACDKLYARMRMQEAVAARDYVKKNFSFINGIHSGVVDDNTIIEETEKDLKAEGLTPTAVNDLDTPPVSEELLVQQQVEMRELDNQHQGDGQAIVDALVAQGELKKVDGQENIYEAKIINGNDYLTGYYIVKDNKIYPVRKEKAVTVPPQGDSVETVEYKELNNSGEVSAEQIASTNRAVERANQLIENKALRLLPALSSTTRQFFKSTGKTNDKFDYYVLQNGKLYHILNLKEVGLEDPNNRRSKWVITFTDGRKIGLKDIAESDLEEFLDGEVKTFEKAREEELADFHKDVALVEAHTYTCLNDIAESNERMDEISREITATPENPEGVPGKFRKLQFGNKGFFISDAPKVRVYRFDPKTKSLKYVAAPEFHGSGYVKNADGTYTPVAEVFMENQFTGEELLRTTPEIALDAINKIQEYGLSFAKIVSGHTDDDKYPEAYRKLYTIIAINDPMYTINFIKGYQSNTGMFTAQDKGMFKQMYEEGNPGFPCEGDVNKMETMENFVKSFAIALLKVADTTSFDRNSDEYKDLQKIANGEWVSGKETKVSFCKKRTYSWGGVHGSALRLDEIVEKLIEAYDKKYSG